MRNTIRILLIILSSIIFNISLHAQEQAKKKVAVYMTGSTFDATYKKVIGAKLVNAITESGEYTAVERSEDFLAALSEENDYQTSGEVRDSQIARLGQKFGVRYVVVADASEILDEYFIAARLINVETGLVERAFDVNGPADSMDQLISLSQKVANGLLLGYNVADSSNGSISNTPVNMSLCAMDKNGKLKYILPEQWQRIPEGEKLYYTKKGVCICENGEGFIVAMRDSRTGNWYDAKLNHAPTKSQIFIMYNNLGQLNSILRFFGGEAFVDNLDLYWSSEADDNDIECGHAFYFYPTYEKPPFGEYSRYLSLDLRIRSVYNIKEIIQ